MIYDILIYDVQPDSVPRYMEVVREIAWKIREDHDYAHFQAVRNDPRWTGEHLPRVNGLVIRQQDMMMRAADFSPGPA